VNRVLIVLLSLLAVALVAVGISSYRKKHSQPPASSAQTAPAIQNAEVLGKRMEQIRADFEKDNARKEQYKSDLTQEIADFNRTLPKDLGDYLTLTKTMVAGNQVEFDYVYAGPGIGNSRDALNTAINAFACNNVESRAIMSNGFAISHRVKDADGRSVIDTTVDKRYCAH